VYTHRIARALARRGHRVHVVVARADAPSDVEDQGVHLHFRRVRWLPLAAKWLPGSGESLCIAAILARLNRLYRFDIVEIPNWEGMALASTWLPGLPVVVRLHTSVAESIAMAERKPSRAERFMIGAERSSARRARALVTHSLSHRARMAAAYGREDIEVIPHGVSIPDQARPPIGKSILSIGRMNARKGMDTLIEAIPAVLAQVPDADFRVVGVDEDHPAVQKFRADHPALRNVEFLGMVDEQRLQRLYDECAIYVSPATYESFGLTFAEAMAHGRPAVGCSTSAVPEIVRDGVDGILVPPKAPDALAGALVTLLSDEELRRRMGANARRRAVEHYSLEAAAARSEGYFARVLEKP
jgi:glycosyltransferase involved in cell wall biosynthesis